MHINHLRKNNSYKLKLGNNIALLQGKYLHQKSIRNIRQQFLFLAILLHLAQI